MPLPNLSLLIYVTAGLVLGIGGAAYLILRVYDSWRGE